MGVPEIVYPGVPRTTLRIFPQVRQNYTWQKSGKG